MGSFKMHLTKEDYINFIVSAYKGKAVPAAKLPSSWKTLKITHDGATGYDGAAYVNDETKEIVVASAGHGFSFNPIDCVLDTLSALKIMAGYEPDQFKSLVNFTDKVLHYGGERGDYKVTFTGHSMGAVLSDMMTASLAYKLSIGHVDPDQYSDVKSVTFENIGSSYSLRNVLSKEGLDEGNIDTFIKDSVAPRLDIYNTKVNTFNLMGGTQSSNVHMIDHDGGANGGHNILDVKKCLGVDGEFTNFQEYTPEQWDNYIKDTIHYGYTNH